MAAARAEVLPLRTASMDAALPRSELAVVELHRIEAAGPWGLAVPHLAAVLTRAATTPEGTA